MGPGRSGRRKRRRLRCRHKGVPRAGAQSLPARGEPAFRHAAACRRPPRRAVRPPAAIDDSRRFGIGRGPAGHQPLSAWSRSAGRFPSAHREDSVDPARSRRRLADGIGPRLRLRFAAAANKGRSSGPARFHRFAARPSSAWRDRGARAQHRRRKSASLARRCRSCGRPAPVRLLEQHEVTLHSRARHDGRESASSRFGEAGQFVEMGGEQAAAAQ